METQPPADLSQQLSPLQQMAAGLIASGQTLSYICAELEIARPTLWRWRKDPAFQEYLGSLVAEAHEAASFKIRQMVSTAVDVLIEGMSAEVPWAYRLKAAGTVLTLAGDLSPLASAEAEGSQPPQKSLSPETVRFIREQIYGVYYSPQEITAPIEIECPDSFS